LKNSAIGAKMGRWLGNTYIYHLVRPLFLRMPGRLAVIGLGLSA
jgi:hypothetical protein